MPKKMSDGALMTDRLIAGENAPPLLSEKLIAQLQGAVEAAQRKRMPPHWHVTDAKDESSPPQ
jgi:hypothetical protein